MESDDASTCECVYLFFFLLHLIDVNAVRVVFGFEYTYNCECVPRSILNARLRSSR